MRTGRTIVVFIFFLGSSNLRQFLLKTKDVVAAEYGAEYTDSYNVNDYHDYKKGILTLIRTVGGGGKNAFAPIIGLIAHKPT